MVMTQMFPIQVMYSLGITLDHLLSTPIKLLSEQHISTLVTGAGEH